MFLIFLGFMPKNVLKMFLFSGFCDYFGGISYKIVFCRVRKALECSYIVLKMFGFEALCYYIPCSYVKNRACLL